MPTAAPEKSSCGAGARGRPGFSKGNTCSRRPEPREGQGGEKAPKSSPTQPAKPTRDAVLRRLSAAAKIARERADALKPAQAPGSGSDYWKAMEAAHPEYVRALDRQIAATRAVVAARLKKAAELKAQRANRPAAQPAPPSPLAQAAAHRFDKGVYADRLAGLVGRASESFAGATDANWSARGQRLARLLKAAKNERRRLARASARVSGPTGGERDPLDLTPRPDGSFGYTPRAVSIPPGRPGEKAPRKAPTQKPQPAPSTPNPAPRTQAALPAPQAALPAPSRPERGTPTRQAMAERLRKARAKAATPAQGAPAPGTVGSMRAADIHFDPERFQYKIEQTDHKTGSVGSLSGVRAWNPALAGTIQVWKDPADGKTYVINGHNRLAKAKELGVPHLNVMHIDAAGPTEARSIGAMANIAEGRGTSTDAAKFFRDLSELSGRPVGKADLERHGIPLREKTASEGLALSGLAAPLFNRVVNGELTPARGSVVGGSGLTHEQQMGLARLMDSRGRKGELNDRDLQEFIDNARAAGSVKKSSGSLFGDDEDEVALGEHRAKLQGHIKARLATERNLFGKVGRTKNARDLARGGNTIDAERSSEIARNAAEALDVFDRLKNSAGPIARHLNEGAERLARGEHPETVRDEAFRRVLDSLRDAEKF